VTSFTALMFFLLDVIFTCLAFAAMPKSGNDKWSWLWLVIIALHLVAGSVTLFNGRTNGCVLSLPLLVLVTGAAGGMLSLAWPRLLPAPQRGGDSAIEMSAVSS
jgi:hypothetical protein